MTIILEKFEIFPWSFQKSKSIVFWWNFLRSFLNSDDSKRARGRIIFFTGEFLNMFSIFTFPILKQTHWSIQILEFWSFTVNFWASENTWLSLLGKDLNKYYDQIQSDQFHLLLHSKLRFTNIKEMDAWFISAQNCF